MGIDKKISSLLKEKKIIHKYCEKCKMDSFITGIPLIADRKAKEWERQHAHTKTKWQKTLSIIKKVVIKYGK